MDMRIRPESEQPGISMEELSPVEQAIQRCTTYDELYRVIDRIGDITTKNYELNIPTPKTYTVAEIKKVLMRFVMVKGVFTTFAHCIG